MSGSRNKPEQARRRILEAAQRHLQEGGPDAVKVQRIARDLELTDAAIHYHFKNRRNLLASLLTHAGADLKRRLADSETASVDELATRLHATYSTDGYARLAMWLSLAGWEAEGSGMFADLVDRWSEEQPERELDDIRHEIAFINLVLAAEPLMGGAFLRSVGLNDDRPGRQRFHTWIVEKLKR